MRRRDVWVALMLLLPGLALADARYDAFEAHLDSILTARSPLADSLFRAANLAREAGRHDVAIDLYGRVSRIVPDFSAASRRQAGEMLETGQRFAALQQLGDLVARDPDPINQLARAGALLQAPEGVPHNRKDIEEAHAIVLRVAPAATEDAYTWNLAVEVGLASGDTALAQRGVEQLVRLSPREPSTWYMAAMVEAAKGNIADARVALARADKLGLPADAHKSAQEYIEFNANRLQRAGLIFTLIVGAAIWVLGFIVLAVMGLALSRATTLAAGRALIDRTGRAVGLDAWLRATYQGVLWLCCGFYYISVPLVMLIVLAIGGGLVFAMLAVGHIPLQLLFIVVVLTGTTVFSMVRSLFAMRRDAAPGETLDLGTQPRFRDLLDRVAARIGTRAVDNVYLTPGTDIAVMERGGMLRQLRGRAERCLILGVGVLEGMTVGQLKAILGHEYGHFSNRDTAGGGLALAVRRSIYTMATRLAHGGAAGWFNPAWWFVRGYHALFLRISQGASRLQEVLADRWAVFAYGSRPLAEGLTHVITTSVRFEAHANAAVNEALRSQAPLLNLYCFKTTPNTETDAEIGKEIESSMKREPSAYDSHPAPSLRLAWMEALNAPGAGAEAEDSEPAWNLFLHREALEQQMTERVRTSIETAHGVKFAAGDGETPKAGDAP